MKFNFLTVFMLSTLAVSQISCSRTETTTETANASVAANTATAKTETNTATETAAPKEKLKEQADEVSQTLINGNYERLADLTHPKVLEMTGGREKMISVSKEFVDTSKKQGIEIVSSEIGEPGVFVPVGNDLYSTVPFTVIIKTPQGKLKQESTVVGISSDKGANWKFVNGINQEKFREMFPEAAGKINIPDQGAPVPVKDK